MDRKILHKRGNSQRRWWRQRTLPNRGNWVSSDRWAIYLPKDEAWCAHEPSSRSLQTQSSTAQILTLVQVCWIGDTKFKPQISPKPPQSPGNCVMFILLSSYLCFWLCTVNTSYQEKVLIIKFYYIYFIWKMGKQRDLFDLLVHFPNPCDSKSGVKPKSGARTQSGSPLWVAGTQVLDAIPAASQDVHISRKVDQK